MNKMRFSVEYIKKHLAYSAILLAIFLCSTGVYAQVKKPVDAASTVGSVPPVPTARTLDSIVAVVNNDVITRNELNERLITVEKQLERNNTPLPNRRDLRQQVLERLIVERAQLQLAKDSGIRIDDTQLDRTIARIAEGNKLTTQAFRDQIEKEGVSFARFREDIRQEMTFSRLREREVDNKINISEGEIDNFLAEQEAAGKQGIEEYNLAQIVLRVPENASPEQIDRQRQRAEQALREIRSGEDFAKASATYSDGPEALKGGELGYRTTDRLPQLFLDAVNGLKPGQSSKIIKSPIGFHILKVLDKRMGKAQSEVAELVATHARHILIKVDGVTTDSEARRRLQEIKERLDNKAASFEELAKQVSQDGAAKKGGDLGWLYPGDTVPEFERAMDALEVGQISAPVRSQFGYHLIWVVERKKEGIYGERMRMQARQALRERRLEESVQEWLRQVRDKAYVDIRQDNLS